MNQPRTMVDQKAIKRVVETASHDIYNLFHRSSALSLDDLEQEGMLAACVEMKGFDEGRGVSVATYLWQRVRNKIRRYAAKQVRSSGMLSLDKVLEYEDQYGENGDRADHDIERFGIDRHGSQFDMSTFRGHKSLYTEDNTADRIDVETIISHLDGSDQTLLVDRFLHGGTLTDLAMKYGISRATIRRRIDKVTARLREIFND